MTKHKTSLKRHHESIDPRIKIASNCLYLIAGLVIIYFVGGMLGLTIGGSIAAASIYGVITTVIRA